MKTLISYSSKSSFLFLILFLFLKTMWAQNDGLVTEQLKQSKVITKTVDKDGKVKIEIKVEDIDTIVEALEVKLNKIKSLEGLDDEVFTKVKNVELKEIELEVDKIVKLIKVNETGLGNNGESVVETIEIIKNKDGSIDTLVNTTVFNDREGDIEEVEINLNGPKKWIKKEIITTTEGDNNEEIDKEIVIVKLRLDDVTHEEEEILRKINVKSSKAKKQNKQQFYLNDLKVAPNPSTGAIEINFDINTKGKTTISIVNMGGQLVFEEILKGFKGNYTNTIDLSDLEKGFYLLQITQGNKLITKKIALQ